MKTAKKIRPKRLTFSALEKKLDKEFSYYIRRRDADEGGTVTCVSCNRLDYWREVDCGHFIKRQHRSTRWDVRNVATQCRRCNHFMGGRQDDFAQAIIKTYGKEIFEELMQLKYQTKKHSRIEIEEMIEKYQELNRELDKRLPRKD
jgi:5-methylcytosine-specific restriction endonuclease McrA